MTPLIDTRTGRLAELVQLLAEVPFDRAYDELDSVAQSGQRIDDPLWMVAGALVHLRAADRAEAEKPGLALTA